MYIFCVGFLKFFPPSIDKKLYRRQLSFSCSIFYSSCHIFSDVDESFVEEQLKIAEQIEQEKRDLEIAMKLQTQLNKESR